MALYFVLHDRPDRGEQQIVDAGDQEDLEGLESRGADGLRDEEQLAYADDAQQRRVLHQGVELIA